MNITNNNINFSGISKSGQKVAKIAHDINNYSGIKKSASDVFQMAKESAWEFLAFPFLPYFWGVRGEKKNDKLHPLLSLGYGAILGALNCSDNIRNIYALNPKLKNTTISQKRRFITEFNDSKSFNLKKSTISRLLKSKQKSNLKDAAVKFPLATVVMGAACLATEALCNIFWLKKDKKS